jgi:hypothetical protein
MKWLLLTSLAACVAGCKLQHRQITFFNQSGEPIDTLKISISSAGTYQFIYTDIAASDTVYSFLPSTEPRSNKHDITIHVTVQSKNYLTPVYSYSYNDLAGYLQSDETIIFDKQKEIRWASGKKASLNH